MFRLHIFSVGCCAAILAGFLAGCGPSSSGSDPVAETPATTTEVKALLGSYFDRTQFRNPYGHIPAQCYIETANGTQNPCLFCHTNGAYLAGLGNNSPQAGYEIMVGDLQLEYAFAALNYPFAPNGSIVPWENTLYPERLSAKVLALGHDPDSWAMADYIREENWGPAFAQRHGSPLAQDTGVDAPFRLLPGLDPADLPADGDGFVRSNKPENGHFASEEGWITGWRAINFMPYGIFTPHSGSVSGIYLRLPPPFMRTAAGDYDLATYAANLDLLERAIQDRLSLGDPSHYLGGAEGVAVERGLYPLGTEFAHPLHYVDTLADGTLDAPSPYPGTRARRVKEVRYMYKREAFVPGQVAPGNKVEDAPIYANSAQGWTDNGAGWILAGFIEAADGQLRPQTAAELTQCVGCHSGNMPQPPGSYANFNSGTGNTIDSTWSFPRKWRGDDGWSEMDYLGYRATPGAMADATPGDATRAEPGNRQAGVGEFRLFLDHVVGASLYGDMPEAIEAFLANNIGLSFGDPYPWPALDTSSPAALKASQQQRQTLLRSFTKRGGHLDHDGVILAPLLYPPSSATLAGAARYRQVVVTQRYDLGKDVFPSTPVTLRYFRDTASGFDHQDGTPYQQGEVITDRPIESDPAQFTYGVGIGETLVDPDQPFDKGGNYLADYLPLLDR
jgi:hypothetical protein